MRCAPVRWLGGTTVPVCNSRDNPLVRGSRSHHCAAYAPVPKHFTLTTVGYNQRHDLFPTSVGSGNVVKSTTIRAKNLPTRSLLRQIDAA